MQFGELYIGATFALLTDISPRHLTVVFIACFTLFTTIIATIVQLSIPLLKAFFDGLYEPHLFLFSAAPYAPPGFINIESGSFQEFSSVPDTIVHDQILFRINRTGADGLQSAMLFSLGSIYILSGVLYICSYFWLRADLLKYYVDQH